MAPPGRPKIVSTPSRNKLLQSIWDPVSLIFLSVVLSFRIKNPVFQRDGKSISCRHHNLFWGNRSPSLGLQPIPRPFARRSEPRTHVQTAKPASQLSSLCLYPLLPCCNRADPNCPAELVSVTSRLLTVNSPSDPVNSYPRCAYMRKKNILHINTNPTYVFDDGLYLLISCWCQALMGLILNFGSRLVSKD